MSWNNFNSCSRDFSISSFRKLIISFVGSFLTTSVMSFITWVLSSLSLANFSFFADLFGIYRASSSPALSEGWSSWELPGVHGEDDDDGSKARSGWQESLVLTTANKALNQLPNPWSSWYLFIPVAVFWVSAACLHWLTHFLNLVLSWAIDMLNLSPLADALPFSSSKILA